MELREKPLLACLHEAERYAHGGQAISSTLKDRLSEQGIKTVSGSLGQQFRFIVRKLYSIEARVKRVEEMAKKKGYTDILEILNNEEVEIGYYGQPISPNHLETVVRLTQERTI